MCTSDSGQQSSKSKKETMCVEMPAGMYGTLPNVVICFLIDFFAAAKWIYDSWCGKFCHLSVYHLKVPIM